MNIDARKTLVCPGYFGLAVAADARRGGFDLGNGQLLANGVRPDTVFIGDSITDFWELQAYFGGTGRMVINRGIGGDTSEYVRKRLEADVLQLSPNLMVLQIGTNDMGWSLEQLDPAISDRVCDNISAMTCRAQEAGIKVTLGSILPIFQPVWYPVPEFASRKNEQIVLANERIKAIAQEYSAIYVDYHSPMTDSSGCLRLDLAGDGVHPHSAGYAIMTAVLREALAANGIGL